MSIVNPGITFVNNGPGAGVTIQANGPANISISVPGFNIALANITNPDIFGTLGVYLGSGSWQVQNPPPYPGGANPCIADAMLFYVDTPVLDAISAVWTRLGYNVSSAYAFTAVWASGQTTTVRLAYSNGTYGPPNLVFIVPIDTGFPGWQSADPFTVPSVVGTYTLPVTLTPFTEPVPVAGNSWC